MFELLPFARRNNVASYNPFRDLDDLEKAFFGSNAMTSFRTDVKETENDYQLEAELPGFKKEDIKISIDGDCMTVSAEHKTERETKDKDNYVRRERSYGAYSRSFDISEVNAENITAEYENGILKLTMPKKEIAAPASRQIEIK